MPRIYRKGLPAKTHGMSGTSIHETWKRMLSRCNNPNAGAYSDYGGRGIAVCERWMTFENFFADMGECPLGHSIERIDNERGYSPDNCCWLPLEKQARNRRGNIYVNVDGDRLCVAEAARRLGIHHQTLRDRVKGRSSKSIMAPVEIGVLYTFRGETMNETQWAERLGLTRSGLIRRLRLGWSLERTLTTPPRLAKAISRLTFTIGGKNVSLADASRQYGIPYQTLRWRLTAGWPPERILGLT